MKIVSEIKPALANDLFSRTGNICIGPNPGKVQLIFRKSETYGFVGGPRTFRSNDIELAWWQVIFTKNINSQSLKKVCFKLIFYKQRILYLFAATFHRILFWLLVIKVRSCQLIGSLWAKNLSETLCLSVNQIQLKYLCFSYNSV